MQDRDDPRWGSKSRAYDLIHTQLLHCSRIRRNIQVTSVRFTGRVLIVWLQTRTLVVNAHASSFASSFFRQRTVQDTQGFPTSGDVVFEGEGTAVKLRGSGSGGGRGRRTQAKITEQILVMCHTTHGVVHQTQIIHPRGCAADKPRGLFTC